MTYRQDRDAIAARLAALVHENRRLHEAIAARVRVVALAPSELVEPAAPTDDDAALAQIDTLEAENLRLAAQLAETPKPRVLPPPQIPRTMLIAGWSVIGVLVAVVAGFVIRACADVKRPVSMVAWGELVIEGHGTIKPTSCKGSVGGESLTLYAGSRRVAQVSTSAITLWPDDRRPLRLDRELCEGTLAINMVLTASNDDDDHVWPFIDGSVRVTACRGVDGTLAYRDCRR